MDQFHREAAELQGTLPDGALEMVATRLQWQRQIYESSMEVWVELHIH